MTSAKLLRLQEVALELQLDLLKLLLGPISSDGGESSSRNGYLRALGFGACGTKFNEHGPLFIGLLVLTRRGRGLLLVLPQRQIKTEKDTIESKRG
jgi:hypothetical protein